MPRKHKNSDTLNALMGTLISVSISLKKKNIFLEAKRIVPKKGVPEVVVLHKNKEVSRFSEEHAGMPFDEMKKTILSKLDTMEE